MIDDFIRPQKKPQQAPTPTDIPAIFATEKRPQRWPIIALCIISVIGLVIAGNGLRRQKRPQPVSATPTLATTAGSTQEQIAPPEVKDSLESYKVAADLPRIISVPSLSIKARVISLGLTGTGAIDTPKYPADAGWYNGSAKPGQAGAVFIDGHVSGETSKGGVFLNLKKVKDGETISIEKGDGNTVTYKVVARDQQPYQEVDMEKALQPYQGKNSLTIITCAGKYDEGLQTFTERLVLYAVQS
jgi:LPXTG-site transpeptidase (sortase) family protein